MINLVVSSKYKKNNVKEFNRITGLSFTRDYVSFMYRGEIITFQSGNGGYIYEGLVYHIFKAI